MKDQIQRFSPERTTKLLNALEHDISERERGNNKDLSPAKARHLGLRSPSPPNSPVNVAHEKENLSKSKGKIKTTVSGGVSKSGVKTTGHQDKPPPPLLSLARQTLTAEQSSQLADNRRKAILRLVDKRRQLKREENDRSERERRDLNLFRLRWREGFKEKRREQLAVGIDKCMLQNTLTNEPEILRELLVHANDHEDAWKVLMSDLEGPHDSDLYANLTLVNPSATAPPLMEPPTKAFSAGQDFLNKTCKDRHDEEVDGVDWRRPPLRRADTQAKDTKSASNGGSSSNPLQEDLDEDDDMNDISSARASLGDCVFLAGPSAKDVNNLIASERSKVLSGKTRATTVYRIEPSILFVTKRDPDVDWETLGYFCFPQGIGATTTHLRSSPMKSPGKPQHRRSIGIVPTHGFHKFAFIQTGMHSNKFGICLVVPRTFRDIDSFVSVTVDYCICVMSSFPFFHFVFHALTQFEANGGLDINELEPLQTQDIAFPVQSEMRMINDLAARLSRVQLPLYPIVFTTPIGPDEQIDEEDDDFQPQRSLVLHPATLYLSLRQQRKVKLVLHRNYMQQFFSKEGGANTALLMSESQSLPGGRSRSETRLDLSAPSAAPGPLENSTGVQEEITDAMLEAERDNEGCFHILLWALPILLKHMPLDQIVVAIGCALTEMKVIVTASDRTTVSGCLLALVHLLRPMKWAGNVIINVPRHLDTLVDSPSFFFLGMPEVPEGFGVPQGFIVVDPEVGVVNLHPTDTVASHTLTLPQSSKLVSALKGYAETIKNVTRTMRRKVSSRDTTPNSSFYGGNNNATVSQASIRTTGTQENGMGGKPAGPKAPSGSFDSIDAMLTTSPLRAGDNPPAPPSPAGLMPPWNQQQGQNLPKATPILPLELDPSSTLARQLYSAVAGFRATMVAHLQALVNTAVQNAWDGKRAKLKAMMEAAGNNKVAPKMPPVSAPKSLRHAKQFSSMYVTAGSKAGITGARESRSLSLTGGVSTNALLSEDSDLDGVKEIDADYADSPHNSPKARSSQSERITGSKKPLATIADDVNSVDESVSSSSSLPRVQTNQVLLAAKDIGESGMKFVKRLMETQAFSNYCHAKSQEGKRKRTRAFVDLKESLPLEAPATAAGVQARAGTAGSATAAFPSTVNQAKLRTHSEDMAKPRTCSSEFRTWANESSDADGFEALKTLTDLFSIVMTGTMPMSRDRIDALRISYDLNDFQNKQGWLSDSGTRPGIATSASLADCGDLEGEILWCNGRCGGRASTPTCTSICLLLWGYLVQSARHQHSMRSLVVRHNQDGVLKTAGVGLRDRKLLAGAMAQGPLVHRQGRETQSQFELRVGLLHKEGALGSDAVAGSEQFRTNHHPQDSQHHHQVKHPPQSSIAALARFHVSRKFRASRRKEFSAVNRCLSTLLRFFHHARRVLAKRRAVVSAVRLQALARGYILRLNAVELFALLAQRKSEFSSAVVHVQIWWRKLPEAIHAQRRVALALRRRSVSDHIPMPMSSPGSRPRAAVPLRKALSLVTGVNANQSGGAATVKPSLVSSMLQTRTVGRLAELRVSEWSRSPSPSNLGMFSGTSSLKGAISTSRTTSPTAATFAAAEAANAVAAVGTESFRGRWRDEARAVTPNTTAALPISATGKTLAAHDHPQGSDHGRESVPVVPVLLIAPLAQVSPRPGSAHSSSSRSDPGVSLSQCKPSGGEDDIILPPRPVSARASAENAASVDADTNGAVSRPKTGLGIMSPANDEGPGAGAGIRQQSPSSEAAGGMGGAFTPPPPSSLVTLASSAGQPQSQPQPQPHTQIQPQVQAQTQAPSPPRGPLSLGTPYPRTLTHTHSTLSQSDSCDALSSLGLDDDDLNPSGSRPRDRFLSTDSITTRGRSETAASDYAMSEKASEADRMFVSGPLANVGLEGKDSFTPQQREILHTMWVVLRGGVEVLKHGLTGKPRQRFLYCDAGMKSIFWRAQGGRPDAELDAEFERTTAATTGYSSWGLGRADSDRFLVFKDILQVLDDITTDVMRRSLTKRYVAERQRNQAPSIISLVCRDRTLDFELDPVLWTKLYHGLCILTNHYQNRG